MSITVYTKAHCPQCDATKRQLTKQGLEFEQETWSGYRPDLIRKAAQSVKVFA